MVNAHWIKSVTPIDIGTSIVLDTGVFRPFTTGDTDTMIVGVVVDKVNSVFNYYGGVWDVAFPELQFYMVDEKGSNTYVMNPDYTGINPWDSANDFVLVHTSGLVYVKAGEPLHPSWSVVTVGTNYSIVMVK